MYNKRSKRWLILLLLVVLAIAITVIAVIDYRNYVEKQKKDYEVMSQTDHDVVYYNGEKYKYNSDIKNILFMGIDNDAGIQTNNLPGEGGQADCIMLLSLNKETKKGTIFQISRDCMTEIDIYDSNGNHHSTMQGQLALQYAYGSGAKNSCWAMKKTVSELFYELPISGYVAMDIAAVAKVNDLLGGVTITIPEDYSAVDEAFIQGQTVTLSGEQAEKYVRYRDVNEMGSSHTRMQRQVQYIPALFETFEAKVGDDEAEMKRLYSGVSEYLVTDLSGDEIEDLMEYTWDTENVTFLNGEIVQGEEFEEFHVDNDALQKTIIELYYQKK